MARDDLNYGAGREGRQEDESLNCVFRRLSIWLSILAGVAALIISLLVSGTPGDSFTIVLSCGAALFIGLFFWAITRGIGLLTIRYRHGTRFVKAYIVVAGLAGIGMLAYGAFQGGWGDALGGLLFGAMICVFILAVGGVAEWLVSGFRLGHGYRRIALLIAILAGLSVLGCILGAGKALGLGFMIAIVWLCCGFRGGMPPRLLASRVGWFVGITVWLVWLIVSDVERLGKEHGHLTDHFPWAIVSALFAGVLAWGIALFLGPVLRAPSQSNGVEKRG